MKKILCFAALLGIINHSFAQNTFPTGAGTNVGIGTLSPGSPLDVSSTLVANGATALNIIASGSATNATYYGQKINVSHTNVGGGGGAIGLDLLVDRSGTGIIPTIGINGIVNAGARAANGTIVSFYGSKFIVNGSSATTSTASAQNYYGTYGEVANNTAVGESSNSYGLFGKASSISTAYGVYGAATGVTGTTGYGGYFTATGGTTNYGVYSAAGTNYFNGNVGVGTVSPSGRLEVVNNFATGTGGSALILSANGNGSSSGTTIYGAQISASTAPGTGSTQTVYGVDINATALGTGPSPLTAVNAKTTLSRLVGSTATGYYGGKFLITGATGTSTATNGSNYGLYGEVANTNATGEVSNSYGVYGKAATVVTATAYGGYFTATGGTTNYGVYSAAGTNYFNGNVGIGVINPQNKVVVAQVNSLVPAALIQDSGTGDAGLAFNVSGASFTWGIDQSDEKKFKLSNSTTLGTSDFITITNGTGNIGIGTVDTKGYKFAINGSAVATSMTVKLNSAWPDYVFKTDYKLPTLFKVQEYIDKNGHLPDMPSEKEVAENGLNLGEMNKILTKKVEELTLYLIEQNKRIEKLESVIKKSSKY